MEHLLRHAGIEEREMVMWIAALCGYRKCDSMGEPVATPRILSATILGTMVIENCVAKGKGNCRK